MFSLTIKNEGSAECFPFLLSSLFQCCQAIAASVCTGDEFPKGIVPRILFLENFFCSRDKSNWSWPHGTKIHVVGSLILQSIFRLPSVWVPLSFFFWIWFHVYACLCHRFISSITMFIVFKLKSDIWSVLSSLFASTLISSIISKASA